MNLYISLEDAIFSVFAQTEWVTEQIKIYPTTYKIPDNLVEFLRLSIIPSSQGVNENSISGILIIEIFSPVSAGSTRTYQIADILDNYLKKVTLQESSSVTQLFDSVLSEIRSDADNPTLTSTKYQITFKHYGVT